MTDTTTETGAADLEDALGVLHWLLTEAPETLHAAALSLANGEAMQTAVIVNAARAWREACTKVAEACNPERGEQTSALVQFAQKAVIVEAGRLLMVRKATGDPHQPGRWELPGGRLQAGEGLDDALAREVREEVGLSVTPGRPLAAWSWLLGDGPGAVRVVAVARLCTVAGGDAVPAAEVDRAVWVPAGEVAGLDVIPSAREPIAAALACLYADGSAG